MGGWGQKYLCYFLSRVITVNKSKLHNVRIFVHLKDEDLYIKLPDPEKVDIELIKIPRQMVIKPEIDMDEYLTHWRNVRKWFVSPLQCYLSQTINGKLSWMRNNREQRRRFFRSLVCLTSVIMICQHKFITASSIVIHFLESYR